MRFLEIDYCAANQGTEMKFSVKDRRVQKPTQLSALIPLSRFFRIVFPSFLLTFFHFFLGKNT